MVTELPPPHLHLPGTSLSGTAPECWLCLVYCTERKGPCISGRTSLTGPPSTCRLPYVWPQSPDRLSGAVLWILIIISFSLTSSHAWVYSWMTSRQVDSRESEHSEECTQPFFEQRPRPTLSPGCGAWTGQGQHQLPGAACVLSDPGLGPHPGLSSSRGMDTHSPFPAGSIIFTSRGWILRGEGRKRHTEREKQGKETKKKRLHRAWRRRNRCGLITAPKSRHGYK